MSNWLGIQAEYTADLNAACGATVKEFAVLRELPEDDALIGVKFSDCLVRARIDAIQVEERMQEKYDQLVFGCTLLVSLVLITLVVIKLRRHFISAVETGIVSGSAIAIKGKRRVQNYGNDLKARIDEEVNRKP